MQTTADKHYEVTHTLTDYTFAKEARAERVDFDDKYMIIHLQDGRIVSVPLAWIPTLANASPADRAKVVIAWDGYLLHWDPDDGPINDDLPVASFMRYDEPEW